jgi:hypothetical protein
MAAAYRMKRATFFAASSSLVFFQPDAFNMLDLATMLSALVDGIHANARRVDSTPNQVKGNGLWIRIMATLSKLTVTLH